MFNLAALLLADGGSTASQSWSFTVSVDEATDLSTGIPVNLYNQDDITMAVDWGDGSESTLTSDDYSALTDMEASIHTYSEAGEYTITLTSGDWSYFYFETNSSTSTGSDTGYYALYYFRKTLISIDTALPEVAGVRCRSSWTTTSASTYAGFYYMFCRCSALTSLPEGLFDNCTAVTSFAYCFYNCSALTSIPEGLFVNNTAVTTFTSCFYNSLKFDCSIHIGSEVVTKATHFMSSSSDYDRYVYVPAGSTTVDTFNALTISGMTVVEE